MNAQTLAQKALDSRARRNPSWATQVGLSGHDHELRASDKESYLDEARELEALLREAEALPPSFDREALVTALSLEHFELAEARTWERNPDLASEFFDHLFSTLIAAHLSPEDRAASLAARLGGVEAFFADAWPRFAAANVPPLWIGGAKKSLEGAPAFFDAVRDAAGGEDVERSIGRAEVVLKSHGEWLDRLARDAKGSTALGDEKFRRLLALRRIGESPRELASLGEKLVLRFKREMEEAALTVLAEAGHEPQTDPVTAALERVKDDHPASFAEVLHEYRASIQAARDFVAARGLATIPDVPLDVVETPAFLRHLIPFAAYMGPARFASPRRGVYLVTPKVELSSFPRADTRNVTVHEAFPGHHLQLSVAAEKASLAAFLCDVPDLTEGWALYCEAIMGMHGYTSAPAERLIRSRDARWRAVRIVLDVGLHAGSLSAQEASARLVLETGMDVEEAEAEVLRYTLAPAYNLSYMWGRLQIERLRERALSSGLSERAFHDALLKVGSVPVALVASEISRAGDIRQG